MMSPLRKVHFLYLYHNLNLQCFKIQLVASFLLERDRGVLDFSE
jgi:hypothetical protein